MGGNRTKYIFSQAAEAHPSLVAPVLSCMHTLSVGLGCDGIRSDLVIVCGMERGAAGAQAMGCIACSVWGIAVERCRVRYVGCRKWDVGSGTWGGMSEVACGVWGVGCEMWDRGMGFVGRDMWDLGCGVWDVPHNTML